MASVLRTSIARLKRLECGILHRMIRRVLGLLVVSTCLLLVYYASHLTHVINYATNSTSVSDVRDGNLGGGSSWGDASVSFSDSKKEFGKNTNLSQSWFKHAGNITQAINKPGKLGPPQKQQTQTSAQTSDSGRAVKVTNSMQLHDIRKQTGSYWNASAPHPVYKVKSRPQYDGKSKLILLWNPFFFQPDYGMGFGSYIFEHTNCSHSCFLTDDRSLMSRADAVVVHTFTIQEEVPVPERASPKQVFVFVNLESPLRGRTGLARNKDNFHGLFNLTMTYLRHGGGVYSPIGFYDTYQSPRLKNLPEMSYLKRKSKMVAWVVSNCDAPSSRNDYVKELSKHVGVDIFGMCGEKTCPGNDNCFQFISDNYMFYLSLENSFCKDYVTEKAFRTLDNHVVPVILGYANYTELLPPKSFIDVRDHSSPRALAKYLLQLRDDADEYFSYYAWKSRYRMHMHWQGRAVGFCSLCGVLHNRTYQYQHGLDVQDFWNPDRLCLTGQAERDAVHLTITH